MWTCLLRVSTGERIFNLQANLLVRSIEFTTGVRFSLQATFVRHRITSALRERGLVTAQLPSNIVYQYPTVEKLAVALHTLITGTDLKPSLSSDQTVKMLEEAALAWSTKVSKHNGKMPLPESTVVVITVCPTFSLTRLYTVPYDPALTGADAI